MRAQTTASVAVASMAILLAGVVYASGQAPVAVADSATVSRGGQLTVLNGGSTSVLANDTDQSATSSRRSSHALRRAAR